MVSVPYEITLLSNILFGNILLTQVSVPYEITLLSNSIVSIEVCKQFQYLMKLHYSQTCAPTLTIFRIVSVPYEITLLSNKSTISGRKVEFQYLMKLHYSQTC